jgi:fatty-acyl-CoA synthase
LDLCKVKPLLVCYQDEQIDVKDLPQDINLSSHQIMDYEKFIEQGDPDYQWLMPENEWDAISVGYTSGTTGDPKGVVSHHRGAYLLAQGNALVASMPKHSVYLWTLPMFHCNGWCFPWTLSAIIGTHVCLRQVRAEPIWKSIKDHKVSHLCGAPYCHVHHSLHGKPTRLSTRASSSIFHSCCSTPRECFKTNVGGWGS